MANTSFRGEVVTRFIDVRFAFSGTIAAVKKQPGDRVKKGDVLASLDVKILQAELDRQLADYEKRRAVFDIAAKTPAKSQDPDIQKFIKQIDQAELDASVKDVELTKYKLDQAQLLSPVDGVATDLGGCVPGVNVTPSANPISVLDSSSLRFRIAVDQESISQFIRERSMDVVIPGTGDSRRGRSLIPVPGSYNNANEVTFFAEIRLENSDGLLPGMVGDARFTD